MLAADEGQHVCNPATSVLALSALALATSLASAAEARAYLPADCAVVGFAGECPLEGLKQWQ